MNSQFGAQGDWYDLGLVSVKVETPNGCRGLEIPVAKDIAVRGETLGKSIAVPYLPAQHQICGVPVFSGGTDCRVDIEDWIKDIEYLLAATGIPEPLKFPTLVRYLSGGARKLVLNLPPQEQFPARAVEELRAEYSDCHLSLDPLADFYERCQRPRETASAYAIELEEKLQRGRSFPDQDYKLTQQFMRGIRDREVRNKLAPMQPRYMTFRQLQEELCQLARERNVEGRMHGPAQRINSLQQAAPSDDAVQAVPEVPPPSSTPHQAMLETMKGLTGLVQELTALQKQSHVRMGQLEAQVLQQGVAMRAAPQNSSWESEGSTPDNSARVTRGRFKKAT
ncbi:zinc finger protein 697 isoform X2 [Pelodiscus sinensis]|uniref:zinc finger protein 697 isoform X2 n=1 Tax=Pelodiscus sinensis TaxID=13735 RepID=UPI003F6BFDDC